jgi:hypothetical protein
MLVERGLLLGFANGAFSSCGTVPKEPLEINCGEKRIFTGWLMLLRHWNFSALSGVHTLSPVDSDYCQRIPQKTLYSLLDWHSNFG